MDAAVPPRTSFVAPPEVGQPFALVRDDGSSAVDGVVEELVPPAPGRPGRFVLGWHVLDDAALAAEPESRVEWTVEWAGDQLTRLRLVHGRLAGSPLTWAAAKEDWAWVLSALKSLLETGLPLAEPEAGPGEGPAATATACGDWHRRQGVEANNSVWELLEEQPSPARDEEVLRRAYAAAYHWQRATGATPANEVRASYLIAKALLATGQPHRALVTADACVAGCREHDLRDFDLVYALEVRARALLALGRDDEARATWNEAGEVEVADAEDRAIVEADVADLRRVLTS